MYSQPNPQQRLARAVTGALFVHYDEHTRRVFVWKDGPVIDVVAVDTGEVLANWPCDETAQSAAAMVVNRLDAGY